MFFIKVNKHNNCTPQGVIFHLWQLPIITNHHWNCKNRTLVIEKVSIPPMSLVFHMDQKRNARLNSGCLVQTAVTAALKGAVLLIMHALSQF